MSEGASASSLEDHLTVAEAARRLGVTPDAIRKRIKRGTIRHDTDPDGKIHVYVDKSPRVWRPVRDASIDTSGDESVDTVVELLRSQVETLRGELEDWKEEARRKDTIIMQLAKRVPELETSPEVRGPHVPSNSESNDDDPHEGPQMKSQRSWWRRFFGFQ